MEAWSAVTADCRQVADGEDHSAAEWLAAREGHDSRPEPSSDHGELRSLGFELRPTSHRLILLGLIASSQWEENSYPLIGLRTCVR